MNPNLSGENITQSTPAEGANPVAQSSPSVLTAEVSSLISSIPAELPTEEARGFLSRLLRKKETPEQIIQKEKKEVERESRAILGEAIRTVMNHPQVEKDDDSNDHISYRYIRGRDEGKYPLEQLILSISRQDGGYRVRLLNEINHEVPNIIPGSEPFIGKTDSIEWTLIQGTEPTISSTQAEEVKMRRRIGNNQRNNSYTDNADSLRAHYNGIINVLPQIPPEVTA